MSQTSLQKYEEAEREYDRTRKRLAADGEISKADQAVLNRIQTKLDALLKKITAEGEVIAVEEPPPNRPSDIGGEIQYEGIPLDKLKEREKNVARENARKVREAIKSLDAWSKRLNSASADYTEKKHKFDATWAHSEDVNAAFSKDLKRGTFRKLSQAAGETLLSQSLANYDQSTHGVETSLSELKEQAFRILAAKAVLEKAEMVLEAYQKEKERDAQSKKLDELKKELEGLKEDVNFVIDVAKEAKKGPAAAAAKVAQKVGTKIHEALVDEIVDGLLGGANIKKEMDQITGRIKALNERLEELKLGGLKAGLNKAFNDLKADEQKIKTAQSKLNAVKTAHENNVGILANLEKDHPGTTTVFSELQRYYHEVDDAGRQVMQASKEYEKVLIGTRNAMSHTTQLRQTVLKDSSDMRALYPNDWANPAVLQQDEHAKAIVAYTNKMDAWYKSQKVDETLKALRDLRSDLHKNKQFEYIGKLVDEVQKQGLGPAQKR